MIGGRPRHVAVMLPNLAGGGAERVALNLVREMVADGHRVDLVLLQNSGPLVDQVPDGAHRVDLAARGRLSGVARLAGYIRRARPEAMLASMSSYNCKAWAARALARVPMRLVVSEHSTLSSEVAQHWYRRLLPVAMRPIYPRCDAVVAVSGGVADDLSEMIGLARERIAVVPNAVVGPEIAVRAAEPADHPWLRDGGEPVVLGVGRLTAQKDFALLLRVFARLRARRPARLVILGEGPDRAALAALAADLGIAEAVDMPGFVDNPYAYMARASVFALSSRWEGLPTVLIEALACGAKIVSTDCPSGPREILEGGRLGRLVPPGEEDAFLAALEAALDDPPPGPRDLSVYTHRAAYERYAALLFGDGAALA